MSEPPPREAAVGLGGDVGHATGAPPHAVFDAAAGGLERKVAIFIAAHADARSALAIMNAALAVADAAPASAAVLLATGDPAEEGSNAEDAEGRGEERVGGERVRG